MDEETRLSDNQLSKDFCIEIDFLKDSERPERIFETLSNMIQAFQRIDESLVYLISSKIEPVLLLEDIEGGSIKLWLAQFLKTIDDAGIKELNWKKIIGKYLIKAKYSMVNFLDKRTTISNRNEIEQLEDDLLSLAKKTDVMHIPYYQKIERRKLIMNIESITESLQQLSKSDKVYYITKDEEKASFNLNFSLSPETIDELFIKERIPNNITMILKVKKPDYIGESMWEFISEGRIIEAKILDCKWREKFQKRKVDVRPGDSIRAVVEEMVNYGYDNEVLSRKFNILEVLEVLPFKNSTQLTIDD